MPAPPLTTKHNVFLLSHFFLVFLYMVLQRLPIITLFLTNVTSVRLVFVVSVHVECEIVNLQ